MTTVNLQVGASGDDGYWNSGTGFGNTDTNTVYGNSGGTRYRSFYRFTGVSGLSGQTISAADIQHWGKGANSGTCVSLIYADKLALPVAPVSQADAEARPLTTAFVSWTIALTLDAFNTSPDISSVIQELASLDPSVIMIMHRDDGTSNVYYNQPGAYDDSSAHASKLDYTYAATATPLPPSRIVSQAVKRAAYW